MGASASATRGIDSLTPAGGIKMLPKEAIDEFKQVYYQEEGIKLSDEDAVILSNNLMSLFRLLLKNKAKVRTTSDHSY